MNIYEEAKKSLDRIETMKSGDGGVYRQYTSSTEPFMDDITNVRQALIRAEKVEELLRLKDEKIALISKYVNNFSMSFDTQITSKLSTVYGKIRKLEKELEELK